MILANLALKALILPQAVQLLPMTSTSITKNTTLNYLFKGTLMSQQLPLDYRSGYEEALAS